MSDLTIPMESDGRPSAPGMPMPDPADPKDGINDDENTDLSQFIVNAFNGEYEGHEDGNRSYPALPEQYQQQSDERIEAYFRVPEIMIMNDGVNAVLQNDHLMSYKEALFQVLAGQGVYTKRSGGSHAGRAVAAGLIGATGIGLLYLASKTRQVRPGRIAFFRTLSNHPRVIKDGWSFEPNPAHGEFTEFDMTSPYINFSNHVHIVRVLPGEYVTCDVGGQPIVLTSKSDNTVAVHVIVDPNFHVRQRVKKDNAYVQAGPLHIFTVPPGSVRAIVIDRKPYVLFEGKHVIECPTLTVPQGDDRKLDRSFSVDGRIHFMVVAPGMIGGVRVGEHACFVDKPTRMWFYSEICEIMLPRPVEAEKIEFHNLTRVRVNDYRMGLIEDLNGNLVVLPPGVHVLRKPNLHLVTTSTEWNHIREDMTAITADPLDVKLRLTMAWHVVDPIAHYKAGNLPVVHNTIREMALSTMSRVVRNMRFEETLRHYARRDDGREDHKMPQSEEQGEGVVPAQMMQNQFKHISDKYTTDLLRVYRRDFGIEMDLQVWGFQNFDLKDQGFQNKLTSAVVARADARAARVKLDLTQDTAEIRKQTAKIEAEQEKYTQTLAAETDREVRLLQVKTQQEVQDAEVNAEHLRKQKEREIEIEDARSKADAEAYSVESKAKAQLAAQRLEIEAARIRAAQEAEAIKLRAEAEREMADANPERFAIEKAGVYAEAVRGMNPSITVQSGADVQNALASLFQAVRGGGDGGH